MAPGLAAQDSSIPVFNKSALGDRLMDDTDLIAEIIAIFLSDIPRRLAILKDHVISGQAAAAGEQAHAIKGAAADVGGEVVRAVALEMEKAGKAGDLETLEKAMPKLEKEFERLKEAMQS